METELARLRKEFICSVSMAAIKQLIDDLLKDGVLNDREAESILEENDSRADKARCLIDTVRKKGDKASRKMISHLQSRDPSLCFKLGFSSYAFMESAKISQKEYKWMPTLIPSTDDQWGHFQSHNIYSVTEHSKSNRVALLITNQTFDRGSDSYKAEKDEQNMHDLLQHLKYEVVKYQDLTAKEIVEALREFSRHPKLTLTDSVFVVIMSQGDNRVLFGTDHNVFEIDHIYKCLSPQNCPALMGKPKVIIIQACREEKHQFICPMAEGPEISDDLWMPAGDPLVHKENDVISFFSCAPRMASYKSSYDSFFIHYIVEVFSAFSHMYHIEELFRKVMQRFEDFPAITMQMPTKVRCTLTKMFYLFPDDSEVKLNPIKADTKPMELMEKETRVRLLFPASLSLSCFTPEVQAESQQISYRFKFRGSGLFQCSLTGLVFDITQEVELLYRIIQWDRSILEPAGKTAAGPLFDIKGCEGAVRQLHFPYCETEEALLSDSLSVIHFSDDGMSILKPLKITDTHVIVEVPHLSAFGLVWDFIKSFWSKMTQIKGQVLLFRRQPNPKKQNQNLDVFLLPSNIPLHEVRAQHQHSDYILVPSKCKLTKDETYTVDCPTAYKVQPKKAEFDVEFGPNYFPTFEIRLAVNTEEITVTIRDQTDTEVWEHDVDLTGPLPCNTPSKHEDKNPLLSILQDLNDDDFKAFKWCLKSELWNNIEPIKEDQLSKADRHKVVDLMVQTYEMSGAVQVMRSILEKIPRIDLVKKLRC